MTERAPLPPIKFAALAKELLSRIDTLVGQWLPGGKVSGTEYFVHSFWRSEKTASLSVCMKGEHIGRWQDHGGDHKGGDLISLYAAIHGMTNGAAAVELARNLGLEDIAGVQPARSGSPKPPRPAPVSAPVSTAPAKPREDEGWVTVSPVPLGLAEATFWHPYRKLEDITHTAKYVIDGALFGYVVRFKKSDGGKETLPYTWCTSARDGASCWKWRTWDEPRPLYFPGGISPQEMQYRSLQSDGKQISHVTPTVILVEGERKADVLQALLDEGSPGVYVVVSWVGGSKAWKKADWHWLAGTHVIAWPDCDGKREQLTKAEKEATPDPLAQIALQQAKPLLPEHKQVGMVAMQGIGAMLRDTQGCTVQVLPIPAPGAVTDGWDCADAIEADGWDFDRVLTFFGSAQPLHGGADAAAAKNAAAKKIDPLAEAGSECAADDASDDPFRDHLNFVVDSLKLKGVHELGVTRKLLIAALRKSPMLVDCLGFNELTGVPSTRVAFPWRTKPGPLEDMDDLAFGDWVSSEYGLKAASRAALAEAMDTVADSRRYHPVRDWLRGLKHDGKPRIEKWLIHVLGLDPATMPPKLKRYMELVGRYMLLGLVARVMKPGIKFDYSPVLEGPGGIGKSTFIKRLVGEEFFSDTHFDIGQGKDGMEQFCGKWAYELSELTALRRADSEQVKQFFSSQSDRFRGAYGRFVQEHPRQLVIFCSTNKKQYLYDTTGNRRFWPFWISKAINLGWIDKYRDQLFAEAFALFQAGAQIFPSLEEEALYFVPEQEKRLVETSVQSRLYELLTREGAAGSEGKSSAELNQLTQFVTIDKLVIALGTDPGKASSLLEGQIRGWLEAHGWEYGRETTGARKRGFKQPTVWPPVIKEDDEGAPAPDRPTQADEHKGDDDEPF